MQYLISRYDKLMTGDFMRKEILKYENIRNLRIDHNYTQKQIAELLRQPEYLLAVRDRYAELLNYSDWTRHIVTLADFEYGRNALRAAIESGFSSAR